jgi:hypothetical protein
MAGQKKEDEGDLLLLFRSKRKSPMVHFTSASTSFAVESASTAKCLVIGAKA